ncbi:MAG: hypothetical protein ABEI77_07280 [Halorientalis sp.]
MSVTAGSTVFPGALATLKREGGRLLVVGDAAGQRTVCRRLFGDPHERRQRMSVCLAEDTHACQHTPATARRVEVQKRATTDRVGSTTPVQRLRDDVLTAIDRHTETDPDPSELRVCLGSLDHLVDAAQLDRLGPALQTALDRVQQANGLAHAHLTASRDDYRVRSLEPLFDAVIEASVEPEPRQRWHLCSDDVTSGWLPLQQ